MRTTEQRFKALGGDIVDPSDRDNGDEHVRIICIPDEYADVTDFDCCNYGNVDDPDYDDSPINGLCKHQRAEVERANRDGVWGFASQYRHPVTGKWMDAEWSCFGFIGDDFKGSGYDEDAMSDAVDAYIKAVRMTSFGDVLAIA